LPETVARTALAAVAAVVANVLLRALAIAVFDIPSAFEHLALRAVIVSTLAGVIAAGLVYAVVARLARDPARTFSIVAVVALLLSFAAPLMVGLEDPPEYPGTDAASVGTLMAMHVVTAAIAVVALTRR
jgi:glucose dehydrogenase